MYMNHKSNVEISHTLMSSSLHVSNSMIISSLVEDGDQMVNVATKNLRYQPYDLKLRKGKQPIVFWGTHHKTGTYLAQKIFALLCSRQNWCCVFQPTR